MSYPPELWMNLKRIEKLVVVRKIEKRESKKTGTKSKFVPVSSLIIYALIRNIPRQFARSKHH